MKKFLIIPVLLIASTLSAQEVFVVPDLACSHKYQFMTGQANAMIIACINYAKASGKTVEDVATHTGEIFAKTWNKEGGFNGLIKGMLHNAVCLTPGGTVEILSQSPDLVKIKLNYLFPELKKNGALLNVTYDEYLLCCEIMISKICDYMESAFSMESTPEGLIWTLKKK